MPIYDSDGTANYEIVKVYDDDGAANHQIGKVYENDGTANHLIYAAEENIVLNSAFQNDYAYTTHQSNWLSAISGTTVNQRRPDQNSAGYYVTSAYILLPTSQYDTLTMTYSSYGHSQAGGVPGGGAAALRTSLASLSANSDAMGSLTNGAIYYCGNTGGGTTTSNTVTWDISGVTTDCYLEIGCMQYGWASLYADGAKFTIESLILT